MNYIYDVTVNFNDVYYDYFEWNMNDNLKHLRKIPIFKIDNEAFNDIYNNQIILEKNIFDKIQDKTEIYGKKFKNYSYCLFSNGNNIIAIEFDSKGESKNISSVSIEEELDILEGIQLKLKNISYKIIKKRKKYYQTRDERKNKNYIKQQLNSLSIEHDEEKIKYLYFEYFNKINNNPEDALNKLKKHLDSNYSDEKLQYYLHLSSNQN